MYECEPVTCIVEVSLYVCINIQHMIPQEVLGVEEEREEIVGIEGLDHMIAPAHMIDQVHMIDQRVERGQIVEIKVGIEMIEVVGIKVEIRVVTIVK